MSWPSGWWMPGSSTSTKGRKREAGNDRATKRRKPKLPMTAAIYANTQSEVSELAQLAESLGWEVGREFLEPKGSREQYLAVLRGARYLKYDVILVPSLYVFAQAGILDTCRLMRELEDANIKIRSLREPWIDTTNPKYGHLVAALAGWILGYNQQWWQEHVGVKLGNEQKKKRWNRELAVKLRDEGKPWSHIVEQLGNRVSVTAIRKHYAKVQRDRAATPDIS